MFLQQLATLYFHLPLEVYAAKVPTIEHDWTNTPFVYRSLLREIALWPSTALRPWRIARFFIMCLIDHWVWDHPSKSGKRTFDLVVMKDSHVPQWSHQRTKGHRLVYVTKPIHSRRSMHLIALGAANTLLQLKESSSWRHKWKRIDSAGEYILQAGGRRSSQTGA